MAGNQIYLYTDSVDDNLVLGREGSGPATASATGDIAFAVYLDTGANLQISSDDSLWLVQMEAISHTSDGATAAHHDDVASVTANTIYVTVEDGDGDTATGPAGLTVSFNDDGPSVSDGSATVIHDETAGVQGAVSATDPNPQDDTATALPTALSTRLGTLGAPAEIGHAQSATGQLTYAGGRDGVADVSLTNSTGGVLTAVASGLFTLAGNQIYLYTDSVDDNLVLGREGSGPATASATGDIAFAVYLDTGANLQSSADDSLWLVQMEPISHTSDGATAAHHDDVASVTANTIYVTVEDGDGDTATGPAGLTVSFNDDGPSVSDGSATVIHDETAGVQGAVSATDPNPQDDTATALPTALSTRLGTLGAPAEIGHAQSATGQLTYAGGRDGVADVSLTNSTGGVLTAVASGLFTLAGNQIYLYTDSVDDNLVLGREGSGPATASATGDIAFAVYLDTGANLQISSDDSLWLVQMEAISHTSDGATAAHHDDVASVTANTIYVTVEDGDGDTATGPAGLTVSFNDDGPSIVATGVGVVHDESAGLQTGADNVTLTEDDNDDDIVAGSLPAELSARLSVLTLTGQIGQAQSGTAVVTASGGTDGLAALTLLIAGGGVSGLSAVDGGAITLIADSGTGSLANMVIGQDSTGDTVFVVYIDSAGLITTVQYEAIDHPTVAIGAAHDDSVDIADGVLFAVATDGDGDTAQVDVGGAVAFEDDGPIDISPDNLNVRNNGADIAMAPLNNVGAGGTDGQGDIYFTPFLTTTIPLLDEDGEAVTHGDADILLQIDPTDGHILYAFVDGSGNNQYDPANPADILVFTVTIDPTTGKYMVDMDQQIDGAGSISFDNFLENVTAGNFPFIIVDNPDNPGVNQLQDLAISSLLQVGTGGDLNPSGTINNSSTDIGTNSQGVDVGEGVRLDLIIDGTLGPSDELLATARYDVSGASFQVTDIQPGGSNLVSIRVELFQISPDDGSFTNADGGTPIALSNGVDALLAGAVVWVYPGALPSDPFSGTGATPVALIHNADGSVTIDGVDVGDRVFVGFTDGITTFDRLEAFNDGLNVATTEGDHNDRFGLGAFELELGVAGEEKLIEPIGVTLEDGDGDTSSGDLLIAFKPEIVGDGAANNLSGGATGEFLDGLGGADTISDGAGEDIITGGDGADTINLAADGERDILNYDSISEAGDTVTGFSSASAASGGDAVDIADLLDGAGFTGTTLQNAIDDGFVNLNDTGSDVVVEIDVTGSSGPYTPLVTLQGIAATTDLDDDNIIVE